MTSLREIKRKARRNLHQAMKVPALYIVPDTNAVVPCNVRVHSEWGALGSVGGTSFAYAEREERGTELIFWRGEVVLPQRGAIVSVEPGEAYRVNATDEPDDQTITAKVTALSVLDASAYPVPDDYDVDESIPVDPDLTNPASQVRNYLQARSPAGSTDIERGVEYMLPLSQYQIGVDARSGLYQTHDYFQGDRLFPFAIDDEYYLRFDLVMEPVARDNTITVALDIGGTIGKILSVSQPIISLEDETVSLVSIFTKVYAKDTFLANGASITFNFQQDVTLTSVEVYIST